MPFPMERVPDKEVASLAASNVYRASTQLENRRRGNRLPKGDPRPFHRRLGICYLTLFLFADIMKPIYEDVEN